MYLYISNYVIYVIGPIDLAQATSLVGPRLPLSHLFDNAIIKYYITFFTVLFVYSQATLRHFRIPWRNVLRQREEICIKSIILTGNHCVGFLYVTYYVALRECRIT